MFGIELPNGYFGLTLKWLNDFNNMLYPGFTNTLFLIPENGIKPPSIYILKFNQNHGKIAEQISKKFNTKIGSILK